MCKCVKEVAYIENESTNIDLKRICAELDPKDVKIPLFEYARTVHQKEKVIKDYLDMSRFCSKKIVLAMRGEIDVFDEKCI